MFIFKEPSELNADWYLGDNHRGKISKKVLKTISNAHLIGIQFLFENFMKKRGGAILNQEDDFNMPLQVSTFLSSVEENIKEETPVLIICSEYSLCKWHYHISEVGFKPKIINPDDLSHSRVCLLSSDLLKLAERFLNLNLFSVVIDDFDELATKLVIKRLRGNFNIGLTKRNFYEKPDQKLKWSMLNWANPGCVGKLNDFYRIDRLHFLAFDDNYRYWWMRLTWKFCNSFEPPNEDDIEKYNQKLQSWANLHNIRIRNENKKVLKRSIKEKPPAKRKKSCIAEVQIDDMNFSNPLISSLDEIKQILPNDTEMSSENEDMVEVKSEIDKNISMKENNDEDCSNLSHLGMVKTENAPVTKDMEIDRDEPILSILFSEGSLKTDDSFPETQSEEKSKVLPLLEEAAEDSTKSQTYQQISDIFDSLSDMECNMEANSDEDTFFSDLISTNK